MCVCGAVGEAKEGQNGASPSKIKVLQEVAGVCSAAYGNMRREGKPAAASHQNRQCVKGGRGGSTACAFRVRNQQPVW